MVLRAYLQGIVDILQKLSSWGFLFPILFKQVVLPCPPDDLPRWKTGNNQSPLPPMCTTLLTLQL